MKQDNELESGLKDLDDATSAAVQDISTQKDLPHHAVLRMMAVAAEPLRKVIMSVVRLRVTTAEQMRESSERMAAAADKQARSLGTATWVLVVVTGVLALATIALFVATLCGR
jgi:CHASE3 domain sensor protein